MGALGQALLSTYRSVVDDGTDYGEHWMKHILFVRNKSKG
jgi:hypothetical protein